MKILSDKGYVGFTTRGRMKFYYAAVDKEACIASEGESILEKLGGNRRGGADALHDKKGPVSPRRGRSA